MRVDLRPLLQATSSKIVLVVIDGLGGFADGEHGSELDDADIPHLDELADEAILGLLEPIGPGITPGSGPGHLALFGYDPIEHQLGRGLLTARGIGVDVGSGDVAARANLCTLADDGTVSDRRAGRLDDEQALKVVEELNELDVAGVEVEFHHVKEHRLLVVLRGEFDPRLADSDPHEIGVAPRDVAALVPEAQATALAVSEVIRSALDVLTDRPANGLLLRGFEGHREFTPFAERFGLNGAAIASYPMYRGAADLVGMDVLRAPDSLDEACRILEEAWDEYDFFFVHHKDADAAGEDGDRSAKIEAIEAVDRIVPRLRSAGADVIAVSADHSTPSQLSAHSWHPVPTLIWNGRERDPATCFTENAARTGALGMRPSVHLMPMLLAMSGRLGKFGA